MPEIEYSRLSKEGFWNSKRLGLLVSFLITIAVLMVIVSLNLNFKETFVLDEGEPHFSERDWLYGVNDTISHYVKDDHLIKRPIILLPEPTNSSTIDLKLICYYVFPTYKTDLFPNQINPHLCTHINLAFAEINQKNYSLILNENQLDALPAIKALKLQNSHLKLIISIGGAGAKGFSEMVQTHQTRKTFIRSLMFFIKLHDLDGVDVDWEFPVIDGNVKEKVKFIQLLNEIRTEFQRHKRQYILSAAVAAVWTYIDLAYYVTHLADAVDYINLMSYDYHFYTPYFPVTGYNAPMYLVKDVSGLDSLNVNFSVNYWISLGMPREKIIVGLPAYGRTYSLVNPDNNGVLAPASGIGSVGENGYATILEICDFLKLKYTVHLLDFVSKVPYAYNVYNWISYDDFSSFQYKGEYILAERLGGAMVWALNTDDYLGKCYNQSFPMVNKINTILFNSSNTMVHKTSQ